MLKSLEIENYILFASEKMEFSENGNVLTGKTGSGKSIFISAIRFISGASSSKELFLDKQKNVKVTAVIKVNDVLKVKLIENHIDVDEEIEISRILTPNMKNKIRINGELITVSELKNIIDDVIDIYSQFDTIKLKNSQQFLSIIDSFIDLEVLKEYKEVYTQYKNLLNQRAEMVVKQNDSNDQLELIELRLKKLAKLNFDEDFDELSEKKKNLDIIKRDFEVYESLEKAIKSFVSVSNSQISKIENAEINEKLNETIIGIEDLSYKIGLATGEFDEYEYDLLVDKISNFKSIMRTFNMDFKELKDYKEELNLQFDELSSLDMDLEIVNNKIDVMQKEVAKKAQVLTKTRKTIASDLVKEINQQITDLEMPDTEFKIDFVKCGYNSIGQDEVQFLLKINAGSDFLPLDKSASGGELARFNLALKATTSANKQGELIVFDEIDTGVSGSVAAKMAIKMQKIAQQNQIIVITHLPQVAVIGESHYEISKETINGVTLSKVKQLDYDCRINNIASLISSDKITKEAINHAKKLYEEAQNKEFYE